MNYNRVYIGGFCTRDPDVRYTPSGVAVTNIGLATNRVWKDGQGEKKEQATFVDVVCFGPVGELAARYLRKGAPAFIEGRLSLDTWEDRVTGNKRSKLKVVCEICNCSDPNLNIHRQLAELHRSGIRISTLNPTTSRFVQASTMTFADPDCHAGEFYE